METQLSSDDIIEIKREQNVSDLVGHIMFNRGNCSVVKITGNNPETGFVEFNNDYRIWIGFSHLRDSFYMNDITGLSARKAKDKIGEYAYKLREKFLKEAIKKATE